MANQGSGWWLVLRSSLRSSVRPGAGTVAVSSGLEASGPRAGAGFSPQQLVRAVMDGQQQPQSAKRRKWDVPADGTGAGAPAAAAAQPYATLAAGAALQQQLARPVGMTAEGLKAQAAAAAAAVFNKYHVRGRAPYAMRCCAPEFVTRSHGFDGMEPVGGTLWITCIRVCPQDQDGAHHGDQRLAPTWTCWHCPLPAAAMVFHGMPLLAAATLAAAANGQCAFAYAPDVATPLHPPPPPLAVAACAQPEAAAAAAAKTAAAAVPATALAAAAASGALLQDAGKALQQGAGSGVGSEALAREVYINDAPTTVRVHLTKRSVQDDIQARTQTVVVTRGRYYAPGVPADPREKPLHLHVKPSGALAVRR